MPTPLQTLASCPLFRDFTDTGLQILASIAQERSLTRAAPIFLEGMQGDALFLIQSGNVRISLRTADGKDQTLALLAPGEYFGELALLSPNSRRMVNATANDEVRLIELARRDFMRLQTQKPQACLKLLLAISGDFGKKLDGNRELLRTLLTGALR